MPLKIFIENFNQNIDKCYKLLLSIDIRVFLSKIYLYRLGTILSLYS